MKKKMIIIWAAVAAVISGLAVYILHRKRKDNNASSSTRGEAVEPFSFDDMPGAVVTPNSPSENRPVVVNLKDRSWWTENKSMFWEALIVVSIIIAVVFLSYFTNNVYEDKVNVTKTEEAIKIEREDSLLNAEKEFLQQQTLKINLDIDTIKTNTKIISNRGSKTKRKEK